MFCGIRKTILDIVGPMERVSTAAELFLCSEMPKCCTVLVRAWMIMISYVEERESGKRRAT